VARKLAQGLEPHHDEACFHAQQSAEKYLKALLEELGQPVPRTHILEDLVLALAAFHPGLKSLRRGAKFLTRYAIQTRYPGENATKRQVASALRWAETFRAAARGLLRIPQPKRRRR
jgi:HEPN domain-containing protein